MNRSIYCFERNRFLGCWCNGNTKVSKTLTRGSIPLLPVFSIKGEENGNNLRVKM